MIQRSTAMSSCLLLLLIHEQSAAQSTIPSIGGPPSFPTGLQLYSVGHADVDATCKKPEHHDRQRTNSSTATLTTDWSDQCADSGAEAAAALQGAAGYNQLRAIATSSYQNNMPKRGTSTGASVAVMFSDRLQFDVIGPAKKTSSCGATTTGSDKQQHPSDIMCVPVKIYLMVNFLAPSFDMTGGGFSHAAIIMGDPALSVGHDEDISIALICNAFDGCRGGSFTEHKVVTVFSGISPATNEPMKNTLTVSGQGSVIQGWRNDLVPRGGGDLMAGIFEVKVCVDPVDGPGAIRVTSQSGTDYSNAANHCY